MFRDRPILRLFIVNWALGIALGWVFAAAVLWADIGGLRSLIMASDIAIPALALLFGGFSITCGGVVCASAIMRLPQQDEGTGSGVVQAANPVPVLAMARTRRQKYITGLKTSP